jgi:hypothetical protein
MRIRLIVGMGGLLLLSGCAVMSTVRAGRRLPPRPADCTITWENLDLDVARARYERVGIVSIGGFGGRDIDTSEKLRDDVRAEACKVGADVVVIGASSASMGVQGTAVWLFHRRGASGAPRSGDHIILHD